MSTAAVETYEPRVILPALSDDLIVPGVEAAIANFARLVAARDAAQRASDDADRAVLDAQAVDELALAEAMVNGTDEPTPLTSSREDDAKVAAARFAAARTAVDLARRALSDAASANADKWRDVVARSHRASVSRFEAAARELRAATADLRPSGALLAMLAAPGSLTMGNYMPAPYLDEAVEAVRVAGVEVGRFAPRASV